MSTFGRSFSSPSPVLTIPPQPAHQASPGMAPTPYSHRPGHYSQPEPSNGQVTAWPPSSSQPASQTGALAGRKRSRDEAAVDINDDVPTLTAIEPIKESEEDWVYGEGMVLIKPNSGYVADASSQSGTWVEEKAAAEEEARRAEAQRQQLERQQLERPALRSHKSQRLEQGSAVSPGQDVPANPPTPGALASMSFIPTLSGDGGSPPVVDDFTLHLGIGWRRISDDEHIQAAARGWARYIENHYPISSVAIRLESKGLQSYLVEASEGYYLFAEDLKQGRLVSTSVDGTMANLKCSPPAFDGSETMTAADTPTSVESPPYSGGHAHPDVEMDLS